MTEKEFNLSEKMKQSKNDDFTESGLFLKKDVKEFINIILEEPVETTEELKDIIRDRAGEKLLEK